MSSVGIAILQSALVLCCMSSWAETALPPPLTGPDIVGEWRFVGMIYEGQHMPPRDARLDLRYSFGADGKSHMIWTYDNDATFCDRRGEYKIEGSKLLDHTLWINPKNRSDCGSDSDMQLDKTTRAPFRLVDAMFELDIPFGSGWITYEWARQESIANF